MKFSLALPIDHIHAGAEFIGQAAIAEMARTAEAAGFDACHVTDHPVPTGRWLEHGGHHAQDPFVMLALAGMATTTIRLNTAIVVLPYRNPFITARAVSSLDAFTNGRVTLGVGAGYLKAEYRALGVPFEDRNDLTDEYLRAILAAWSGDEFTFAGTGYEALGNRILPRPVQTPHPPVWVGGNSKRAIRRAVDLGDGWAPFAASGLLAQTARTVAMEGDSALPESLNYLREYVQKQGRTAPLAIIGDGFGSPRGRGAGQVVDEIGRLAELGMSWVTVSVDGATRAEWCDNVRRYAEDVAATFRT